MRIIGGEFKGKKLKWASDATTRPTSDRAKEGIFNALMAQGVNFKGARVLDLFSGSGQLGLECISRGSRSVILNDPSTTPLITENLNSIPLNSPLRQGGGPRVAVGDVPISNISVTSLDFLSCLLSLPPQSFDLIFLDPPYAQTSALPDTINFILKNNMLAPGGRIVAESPSPDLNFPPLKQKTYRYGRAHIYILTLN